jgi:CRP-like cAMP-binding protein
MFSTVEKVLFFKSVDLFSSIPGEELAQIADIAQEINFERGELIIQEGEQGDSLFLITAGEVMVHRLTQELTQLGYRQSFGEMSLLDSDPRSATVTALSDVTCLKVERDDFYELMADKIGIAHGIIRVLTQRLREANEQLSKATGKIHA